MKRILFFSVGFTLLLYMVRVVYTGSFLFFFIPWNLFLAWLPLLFSHLVVVQKNKWVKWVGVGLWLLFLPNAPYVITDLIHLEPRYPVPFYFDLILLFSAAWNGLLMGLLSIKNMEQQLGLIWNNKTVKIILCFIFILSGFGIYLGRYDRYNSWNIITQPVNLIRDIAMYISQPFDHVHTWAVTCLFGIAFYLMYETIRKFHTSSKHAN